MAGRRPVVIAVDESEESMNACEWACTHLTPHDRLILLHVQPPLPSSTFYILNQDTIRMLEYDAKRTTEKIMKIALSICSKHNVEAETYIVQGNPKEMICKTATNLGAHVLVMGSHKCGFLLKAIKGSVSEHCSRNADCPVVVINAKTI